METEIFLYPVPYRGEVEISMGTVMAGGEEYESGLLYPETGVILSPFYGHDALAPNYLLLQENEMGAAAYPKKEHRNLNPVEEKDHENRGIWKILGIAIVSEDIREGWRASRESRHGIF